MRRHDVDPMLPDPVGGSSLPCHGQLLLDGGSQSDWAPCTVALPDQRPAKLVTSHAWVDVGIG